MSTNHFQDLYDMLYQRSPEDISPILLSELRPGLKSLSKQKDCGPTKIDINISLSNNSNQNSTSVSFSNELATESIGDLRSLIETFVKDVEEVYGLE